MKEFLLAHLQSLFMFVALLISFVPRIVQWRSWRNCGVFVIASGLVFAQLLAGIANRHDMYKFPIALAVVFALYFLCLLAFRRSHFMQWTVRQRIVTIVFALAVMLPTWFFDAKNMIGPFHMDAFEHGTIPAEILGLQTSVDAKSHGMVRKVEIRCFDGKDYKVCYLEDEVPRKVDGAIFASVIIRCSEKTRRTVGFIADTDVLSQSDENTVMDIAQIIAREVGRVCGFKMNHPIFSSIHSGGVDDVILFSGHGGNVVAEVSWINPTFQEKRENSSVAGVFSFFGQLAFGFSTTS